MAPSTPAQARRQARSRSSADRPTNNSTELAAILLALRCMAGLQDVGEFEVTSDSQWAIEAAQRELVPTAHADLAAWAAAMVEAHRRKRQVRFTHINGHVGHPWNELADAIAGHVVAGRLNAPAVHELLGPG
eukprot:217218-Alexandrium_andersonii.AAC.1